MDAEVDDGEEPLTQEERDLLDTIRQKKKLIKEKSIREKTARTNNPIVSRAHRQKNIDEMASRLEELGMDSRQAVERVRSTSRRRRSRSRTTDQMDVDDGSQKRIHSTKSRSLSRGRSESLAKPSSGSGLKDIRQRNKAIKMSDRSQRLRNKMARKGEGDRHIPTLKPKHLLTGIRGIGKTQRR